VGGGTFINSALSVHAYCIQHACAHGGASQGYEDYQELEATVYRLAAPLVGLDDTHQAIHKRHHAFTNSAADPDWGFISADLADLGPGTMVSHNTEFDEPGDPDGKDWLNTTGGVVKSLAIEALRRVPELEHCHDDIWCTTQVASRMCKIIMMFFFGRYPHRGGVDGSQATDSFFENTYRGQGQIDLWMMGGAKTPFYSHFILHKNRIFTKARDTHRES
jgi:hypothetical protein